MDATVRGKQGHILGEMAASGGFMSSRRRWKHKPKQNPTKGNGKSDGQARSPIADVEGAPIISICIPSDDHVHAAFYMSTMHMLMHTMVQQDLILKGLTLQHVGSSLIPHSRYSLVKNSQRHEATHLLFIDSDMAFPVDTLVRLLRHDKDMVGINAMSRRPPYNLTAWKAPGVRMETTVESTGLERAWRSGLAVVLIKAHVFDKIELPYFAVPFLRDMDEYGGEDYYFFDKAHEAGFELWIDHDLSKEVDHMGMFPYNPMMKEKMGQSHDGVVRHEVIRTQDLGTVVKEIATK